MSNNNGNISGGKIESNLKNWICKTPVINSILTNPIFISILILGVIWLLDLLYGKTFEETSTREIIQHSFTVFFVMMAGIFLNNLAITKCEKTGGSESNDSPKDVYYKSSDSSRSETPYPERAQERWSEPKKHTDRYDEVISRYE